MAVSGHGRTRAALFRLCEEHRRCDAAIHLQTAYRTCGVNGLLPPVGVAMTIRRECLSPCRPRRRLPRRIASASQVRFYVLISIYYRNHEERSDVVIPCKYWHPCRPVPGLLHPLTRVRKFESDIISSERGTDRNPSPFLPVRMCVYGNCVVLLRTVFATAPIVPFDLFQSGSACRIVAIAYAFAVVHERPRRASAPAAAVCRRIAAIAPRFA